MMAPNDIVLSLAGHDKHSLYLIVAADGDRLLLCDGRHHRLSNPKSKNPRHVRFLCKGEAPATDRQLSQTLARIAAGLADKPEEEINLGER